MKMNIVKMECRLGLADLLNKLDLVGIGVEVGVWRGDFSIPFKQRWLGQKLYLVDPWMKLDDYDDIRCDMFDEKDYEYVLKQTQRFGATVEMVQSTSEEAAIFLPNNLDFVYIDANHSYEHTLQDLNLWWPKMKKGGILAGHDMFNEAHPEVHKAVFEFAETNKLEPYFIPDYPAHSYFFQRD